MNEIPKPPNGLSKKAINWWNAVNQGWVLDDGALMILEQALIAFDRLNEARAVIKRDGITIMNPESGLVRAHPALKVENDSQNRLLRAWKQLSLDADPPSDNERRITDSRFRGRIPGNGN